MKRITTTTSTAHVKILLGFLLAIGPALALSHLQLLGANPQGSAATISGTVVDQNNDALPGVTVTLNNVNTAFQRQATTNENGQFTIPLLPASTYTLTAQHDGFAPFRIPDLVLNVNDQRSLAIRMTVAELTQSVDINSADTSISTSPAIGTVIDRQFVQNLPLNGRSFQSLISITPGVTLAISNPASPGQFSVNGQRTNSNNFSVDGVSANIGVSTSDLIGQQAAGSVPALTSFGGTNNLISIDALQEFRIQTSTFAPEFGRSPGAQISLVSRPGTGVFHGSFFEYFRNDKLDANDYFSNRAGLPRTQLRQNQFGFVVGGPILLPRFGEGGNHWLNGKEHSFFFLSYEGLRLRQPQTVFTTVPSLRIRQSAADNVRFLLNAFPIPTGPEAGTSGFSPFTGAYSDSSTLNATSFRIDHNFSSKISLFGRFNHAPSQTLIRTNSTINTPSELSTTKLATTTLTFGSTQTMTSRTLNEVRFNYSRTSGRVIRTLDTFGGASPVSLSQLIPPAATGEHSAAQVSFFNGTFGVGNYNDNSQHQLNLIDNLSLVRNSHSFKLGIDYRRLTPVWIAREFFSVVFFTSEGSITSGRYSLGFVQAQKPTRPVFNNFSAYFQDTWQASQTLVLTYGARWDVNPPPSEADGQSPFALTTSDPLTTKLAPPGTPLYQTTWNNIAPRFGLSYLLSQKSGRELALRGGIGLFYDLGNTQTGDAFTRGPFNTTTPLLFNQTYPLSITPTQIPQFPTDGSTALTFVADPKLKLPYTWQWNITAQQSIGVNQTLTASYIAAIGRRLIQPRFIRGNPNFQFLQFADNGSTSDYHSLQLQFNRRLSRNVQALTSYTWSHSIDNISDETALSTPRKGDSDFDVRHNFSAAFQYSLPWRPRGITGYLLRNWQTDLIVHAQSAYPFTPFTSQGGFIAGNLVTKWPDLIEGVPIYLSDPSVAGGRRVNRDAFRVPPPGLQGNLGRNTIRGFPTYQIDFSLQRRFNINESTNIELRGEAFNLFNHPNFGLPVADLNNALLFGQSNKMLGRTLGGLSPIYQIGGPRSIQLSARLNF